MRAVVFVIVLGTVFTLWLLFFLRGIGAGTRRTCRVLEVLRIR
jgi:hypothetical protein